jgi:hypothetical protein
MGASHERAPPAASGARAALACAACRHFHASPRELERLIPGLLSMGSGAASVRDCDGVCIRLDRLVAARSHCSQFERR